MEVIKILRKLVKFNTINDLEVEKIMDYLNKYLKNLGFKTKFIDKCLIAQLGNNPQIGYLAHTDTVDYESWDGNPFSLQLVDNKIIGLGVCDMKGSIAAMLAALSQINLENKDINLYFTYGEETTFKGIRALINEEFPHTMIIGEPTDNIPVYGTKGYIELTLEFYGKKAHSSTPEKGINAIYECISLIDKLKIFYEKELKKDIVNDFEISYTTMNIGKIKGGETVNSVPGKCQMTIDFRIIKESHIDLIINHLEKLIKKYNAKIIINEMIKPKLNLSDISYIESISSKKKTESYFTEANFIESNTVILGPGPITAHEKNEYITTQSLAKCVELYKQIIEEYNM